MTNNLALAPMAGTTDLVFRQICQRMGAGLTVTELVSARGIVYDPKLTRTWPYLEIAAQEKAVAIQLFGSEPADFATAIKIILSHPQLSRCSWIDLNMGCPVPKVVKQGAGSALLRNPSLAAKITAAAVSAAADYGKAVTVKIRSGWDDKSVNCHEVAKALEASGAAALTVHARSRQQMYGGKANWQHIALVKQNVKIPVYGNGDINSPAAAREMITQTGADGIMIGRAALGNPWIFASFFTNLQKQYLMDTTAEGQVSKSVKMEIIMEHLEGLIARSNEATAVKQMRKHVASYLRGGKNASSYRQALMQVQTKTDFLRNLEEWSIN